MTRTGQTGQVLFIQGGGVDTHDASDDKLVANLGARLQRGMAVHLVHGLEDDTVPPSHADLYARAIPQAYLHLLPGRDHQLGNDLAEVAELIRASKPGPT